MTALDAVVQVAEQVPADLPRLTASQVFIYYARMNAALGFAVEASRKIPDATAQASNEYLREIVKQCEGAAKAAARLIESNK